MVAQRSPPRERRDLRAERLLSGKPVRLHAWGVVQIGAPGNLFGRVGYYDDDEARGMAVVYLENPLEADGYYVLPRSSLREVDAKTTRRWWRKHMPDHVPPPGRPTSFAHLRLIDGGRPLNKPTKE